MNPTNLGRYPNAVAPGGAPTVVGPKKSNTALYIIIGIGLLMIGLLVCGISLYLYERNQTPQCNFTYPNFQVIDPAGSGKCVCMSGFSDPNNTGNCTPIKCSIFPPYYNILDPAGSGKCVCLPGFKGPDSTGKCTA